MPEYLLVDMTAEDDFLLSQRALRLLGRYNIDASNLPPPTKFYSAKTRNQPIRSYSSGFHDLGPCESQLRSGKGSFPQYTAQV